MRRDFLKLLALGLLTPRFAAAQRASYSTLPTEQHTYNPGKIEVAEFFWYGCPHCYNLEPFIESWLKKKPADVAFVRIPAILGDEWARAAAFFYPLASMALLDNLPRPLFDATPRARLRTGSPAAFNEWLEKNGVDPKKFDAVIRSPSVD